MTTLPFSSPGMIDPFIEAGSVPLDIRNAGDVAVITVRSPSLREPFATAMADRLIALSDLDGAGLCRQAVSLEQVEDVTVATLNAVLRVHTELTWHGGELVLFRVPRALEAAIDAAGARGVLRIEPDVDAAITAGKRPRLASRWLRRAA